jgi:transcription antitermination factor NusA-like protein
MSELGEEKIDIISYSEDPARFIESALSPAKEVSVKLNEEEKIATVTISEDQLSLAIGKKGQNVRLAAKLTGWKIDIVGSGVNLDKSIPEPKDKLQPEIQDQVAEETKEVPEVVDVKASQ